MSSTAKNPHIDNATEDQLMGLLEGKPPILRQLYLDIHRLMREVLPDVTYSTDCTDGVTGYGARQYGYDGWGMAALAAHSKWVSLMFLRGADLNDPDGLLEGTGKKMRHVKLRSPEQLEQRLHAVRALIKAAATINGE